MFFFEKKNQKTFPGLARCPGTTSGAPTGESLFASFSSEKEDSFLNQQGERT
jgi:hypothetical protein